LQIQEPATTTSSCSRCARPIADHSGFVLVGNLLCLRCSVQFRPMVRRSLITALVVGTLLVAINQGTVLLEGDFPSSLYWKIPLTYVVPFCVASWGALVNSRR
jgi:hypothetical protein